MGASCRGEDLNAEMYVRIKENKLEKRPKKVFITFPNYDATPYHLYTYSSQLIIVNAATIKSDYVYICDGLCICI